MINFDDVTELNRRNYNRHWLQIPDHPYTILIVAASGSEKTNKFLYLTYHQQPVTDKVILHAENPYESKFHYLIKKREGAALKYFKNRKAFMEYSNDMNDSYKSIKERNLMKERKYNNLII